QTYVQWNSADIESGTEHLTSTGTVTDMNAGVYNVNMGFGTRIYDNLSLGFAINLYQGKGSRNVVTTSSAAGFPLSDLQRVLLVQTTTRIDSSAYSGTYFTMGLKYTKEKLNAGLIVKTPHKMQQETDVTYAVVSTVNGNVTEDGSETFYFDDNIIEVEIPITVGLGLSYKIADNWLWALDGEYRPFSGKTINIRDSIRLVSGEKDKEYFSSVDPDWNDVIAFRLGTEYMWSTGSDLIPLMPLRAGFGYAPIPAPGLDDNFSTTTESSTSFSLGTGMHWEQIHLDLAFRHSSLTFNAFEFTPDPLDSSTLLALPYEISNSSNSLEFMFTGFF
ncbi:MAG: outer membrane protein transport protein, partial [candidate division Zixibacteria bacterium]|nr:outer membrane protein transport protein [candidate division Zixibacteria bacterium]